MKASKHSLSSVHRSTWTPTNASMSFSNSSRRSAGTSEGEGFYEILEQMLYYQRMSAAACNLFQTIGSRTMFSFLVQSKTSFVCRFWEMLFVLQAPWKWETKGSNSGLSVGLTGDISHGGLFWARFVQTMRVRSLWRCQSNDLVPSVLLPSWPFQWCATLIEERDNFLNPILLCTDVSPTQWSRSSPAQSNFPPEWAERGWVLDRRG